MTVPSTTRSVEYTGTGSLDTYEVPFQFQEESHLEVVVTDTDDVSTTLVLDTDYSVSGSGSSEGGEIVLTDPLEADFLLTVERVVPTTQETSFRSQSSFSPKTHENSFDKLTMIAQQLEDEDEAIREDLGEDMQDLRDDLEADPDAVVIDNRTVVSTGSVTARSLKDRFAGVANVLDFGAAGDGVADDGAEVDLAQTRGSPAVQSVHFPKGTYLLGGNGMVIKAAAGTTYRGDGMYVSTLKSKSDITNWLVQASAAYPTQDLVFEDLCFDTNSYGIGGLLIYGQYVQNVTFRRCRFVCKDGYGLILSGVVGATVEDCEFFGGATADSVGISISEGSRDITVRNCKFRYCAVQMQVDSGDSSPVNESLNEWLTVEGCDFDQSWWSWPTVHANSGGTVTYSGNAAAVPPTGTLTDTAGSVNTAGLAQYGHFRVLEVRESGMFTSAPSFTSITDAVATFVTAQVLEGEFVRSGTKFAMIAAVESQTVLRIEEWLDQTTFLPVAPPANGASYTVYKVILAQKDTDSNTQIVTYTGFHLLDGTSVVPANGSRYELFLVPIYNLHVEYGCRNVRIANNKIKRGWGDNCSIYSNRAEIIGNTVSWGGDVGITLNGTTGDGHSVISGNRISNQGAIGIFCSGQHVNIVGNNIMHTGWVNHIDQYALADIRIQGAGFGGYRPSDISIVGNYCDGGGRTYSRSGIALYGTTANSDGIDDIYVAGNVSIGHTTAEIAVRGDDVTGLRFGSNVAKIDYSSDGGFSDGAVCDIIDLVEQGVVGTPESQMRAGIGSLARSSAGKLYIKATGTADTGWLLLATNDAISLSGNELSNNAGNPGSTLLLNGGIRRGRFKKTIPYTGFVAAATTQNMTVLTFPAKTKIVSIVSDVTTGFDGPGTNYSLAWGVTGAGVELIADHQVNAPVTKGLTDASMGTAMTRAAAIQGGYVTSWTATVNLNLFVWCDDANLGNGAATTMTQGSVTVYIDYEVY